MSFLRTVPPYSHQADVWVELLKHFHYRQIVFIHSSDTDGRSILGKPNSYARVVTKFSRNETSHNFVFFLFCNLAKFTFSVGKFVKIINSSYFVFRKISTTLFRDHPMACSFHRSRSNSIAVVIGKKAKMLAFWINPFFNFRPKIAFEKVWNKKQWRIFAEFSRKRSK